MARPTRIVEDRLWERHANPASGWTRLLAYPLLMYAIYARRRRLFAIVAGYVAVNPVLFSPPEDDDAWMTRVVLGERLWYRHRGARRPADLLNYCNVPISVYALYSAYRGYPVRTAVFTLLTMITKLLFVATVARYYDRHHVEFPDDVPAFARD